MKLNERIYDVLRKRGIHNTTLITGYYYTEVARESVGCSHLFSLNEPTDGAIYEDFLKWEQAIGYIPTEDLMD